MIQYVPSLYTKLMRFARPIMVLSGFFLCIACSTTLSLSKRNSGIKQLSAWANETRTSDGLQILREDNKLSASAQRQAELLASQDKLSPQNQLALPRIVKEGVFARFALSHETKAPSLNEAISQMQSSPLFSGKLSHTGITHMGIGIASSQTHVYVVTDLARVIPNISPDRVESEILEEINLRRKRINIQPLEQTPKLQTQGKHIVNAFISMNSDRDSLIQEAKSQIAGDRFSLGRLTIAFQVVSAREDIVIPERTTDPAISMLGIGVAQGNHAEHEPGAIAVAMLLARAQSNLQQNQTKLSIPPPKAVAIGQAKSSDGTVVDQAWMATLTGNHKRAATLFAQGYIKYKQPKLLYEAARAYARHGNTKSALNTMRRYAGLVTEKDKQIAEEMIQKLEDGKSIFTSSKSEKLSVEAKRFFIMGQNLFNKGQWDGAIDAFQQAHAYAPHPDLLYNIGLAHLKAGRIGDALDFFAEYQRLVPQAANPDQAKQLFHIGVELYSVGQYDAAAKRFTMAYSFLPIPELLYNLALCHKDMNNNDEALRILKELLDAATTQKEKDDLNHLILEIEK